MFSKALGIPVEAVKTIDAEHSTDGMPSFTEDDDQPTEPLVFDQATVPIVTEQPIETKLKDAEELFDQLLDEKITAEDVNISHFVQVLSEKVSDTKNKMQANCTAS